MCVSKGTAQARIAYCLCKFADTEIPLHAIKHFPPELELNGSRVRLAFSEVCPFHIAPQPQAHSHTLFVVRALRSFCSGYSGSVMMWCVDCLTRWEMMCAPMAPPPTAPSKPIINWKMIICNCAFNNTKKEKMKTKKAACRCTFVSAVRDISLSLRYYVWSAVSVSVATFRVL